MAYTLTYSYANQAYTVSGYTGTPDNVVIPETYDDGTHGEYPVTSIGYAVFYMCSSLKSVTIGNNVTSIGDGAFAACSNLTNIIIPNSVTSLGTEVFYNCTSLTSVTIGNGVTSIGYATFRDCSSLTSITIPDSVTSIGSYVFSHCSSLTSITIANSVTNIGLYAFYYCTSLTNITIPDSVTSIGEAVFAYCSSLQNIILLPNTPPTVGMNAIVAVSANAKFYCYKSSENAYKTATNWNSYASKIIGDDIALYFGMNANSTKNYIDRKTIATLPLSANISADDLIAQLFTITEVTV